MHRAKDTLNERPQPGFSGRGTEVGDPQRCQNMVGLFGDIGGAPIQYDFFGRSVLEPIIFATSRIRDRRLVGIDHLEGLLQNPRNALWYDL